MKLLISILLILSCAAMATAQTATPATPSKPAPLESFAVDVTGAAWESGELRTCSTYFQHPKFLLCDDDIRTAVVIGWQRRPNGDNEKIDPENSSR